MKVLVVDSDVSRHDRFADVLRPKVDTSSPASDATASRTAVEFCRTAHDAIMLVTAATEKCDPYGVAFVDAGASDGIDGIDTVLRLWRSDPFLQIILCTDGASPTWDELDRRLGDSHSWLVFRRPFDDAELRQLSESLSAKRSADSEFRLQLLATKQEAAVACSLNHDLELLTESTGEGMYGVDRAGLCTYINTAGAKMLGYERHELIGLNMHELVHHHRPDGAVYPVHQCRIYQAHLNGRSCRVDDEVFWTRDGKPVPVEYGAFPIINGRDVVGTVVTYLNISDRLKATEELKNAKRAAESASRAKSQFLAQMSHEIRTPLNGAIGMMTLLEQTGLNATQARYARIAKSSADALLSLISDILDVSKIEAGKFDLRVADFSLSELLQKSLDVVSPAAAVKNIEVKLAIDPSVPRWCRGDADRLRQILLNLLSNGVKFTEAGSVSVMVSADSGDGKTSDATMVRFEVRDTGAGIPAEKMDRLFKPFSQVDASNTRKFGGTGLGLVICRELAELMGGTAGARSEPGFGSTFWFTAKLLPAESVEPIEIGKIPVDTSIPAQTSARPKSAFKILLAEDNEVNQLIAGEFLALGGYAYDIVGDGDAAITAAQTGDYDLILMDCQMPGIDGYQAVHAIRDSRMQAANGPKRPVPIIALTANATAGDRETCIETGFDDYLAKPVELKQLHETIAKWLSVKTAA